MNLFVTAGWRRQRNLIWRAAAQNIPFFVIGRTSQFVGCLAASCGGDAGTVSSVCVVVRVLFRLRAGQGEVCEQRSERGESRNEKQKAIKGREADKSPESPSLRAPFASRASLYGSLHK